jgi:xanthine dehydrogenase YagS FAD-binding subunit
MQSFEYAQPKSLKEATALLGPDAAILAGGTDLLSLMKDYIETPKRVVNIKGVKELGGIGKASGGFRIGATVTFDELLNHAAIRSEYPALSAAAMGVASPQIRNMGTVGGDLCQRPRCWYYRTGNGLLGMKGGKSLVVEGENQYHGIFGNGPAYFVSASSLGPVLVALGAKVKIASGSGNREVSAEQFFVAPSDANQREIALQPGELVTEILIPSGASRNGVYEIREKDALDWPLVTAAVALKMNGSSIGSARIVLGHVGPIPHVATEAEKMLAGKSITEDVAQQAGEAAVAGAKPLSQNAYKVQLAKVAVKRALLEAAGKRA